MLALVCKKSDAVDMKAPLLAYVRATYSDNVADDAADDLSAINQQRSEVNLALDLHCFMGSWDDSRSEELDFQLVLVVTIFGVTCNGWTVLM